MELENLTENKFQIICDNTNQLAETLEKIEEAKVQTCITDTICDGCNS